MLTTNAIFSITFSLLFLTTKSVGQSGISHQQTCSTPPPGCFIDCPDGYEPVAGTGQCLCLCKQPNCYGFSCKSNERCVNVNGRVGCVPVIPVNSNPPHQSSQLARPVVPSIINSVHLGPRDQYHQGVFQQQQPPTSSPLDSDQNLVGECPAMVSGNCDVQCRTDRDCPVDAGFRCCPNGCGRECVLAVSVVPFKSHLAIRPLKTTNGGGGRGEVEEREKGSSPNPLEQCEIKCSNPLYACQLVESDCGKPPCPPVPKCLINPCPVGSPMKLANGVTALCKRPTQCWDGFWCHQIGYNGLGFCCPEPAKLAKSGECAAQQTKRREERGGQQQCSAECKSDSECAAEGKCCFDGCGMSCRRPANNEGGGGGKDGIGRGEEAGEGSGGGELAIFRPIKEGKKGKEGEKPPECPILTEHGRLDCAPGMDQCAGDKDCPGHLKCCSDGCQRRCTYIPPSVQKTLGEEMPAEGGRRPNGGGENLVKMVEKGGGGGAEEEESMGSGLIGSEGKKIGQCPKMDGDGTFCNWKNPNECQIDADCVGLKKCCSDGCGSRICLFPAISTECLSLRAAAQIFTRFSKHNRAFRPKCDESGRFLPVQSASDGFAWCVDGKGQEMPGTRSPRDNFEGCERRRVCPIGDCPLLKCPFGYQMDGIGCPQCVCRDSPCRSVQCPEGNVCRMVAKECFNSAEDPSTSTCLIPECTLNTCLGGEPLEDVEMGGMFQCDEAGGKKCPPGFYCHKLGIGPQGYCCAGLVLQSELLPSATKCPARPNIAYKRRPNKATAEEGEEDGGRARGAMVALGCRFSRECSSGKFCCFNGWGSACSSQKNGEEREDEERDREGHPHKKGATFAHSTAGPEESTTADDNFVQPAKHSSGGGGTCPAGMANASNPGCASNCLGDADCAQQRSAHQRCCPLGCGQQCQFPERLSPCVHLLATTLREVDKLVNNKMPAAAANTLGRPTVQCTQEGLFQPVQFDAITGQYWCVDPLSGVEQWGTRISSSPIGAALPDCSIRHQCKIACPKERVEKCGGRGVKLDHRGCPVDERCECQNPCDAFKCSLPASEICILKRVKCVDGDGPCPLVPFCVKNVCGQLQVELANNVACSSSTDCADGECRMVEGDQMAPKIGLCCRSGQERQFEQPIDDTQSSLIVRNSNLAAETGRGQGICPTGKEGRRGDGGECADECVRDTQCASIQKCCPIGEGGCRKCVQPMLATNCQNVLSAVHALGSARIHHFIPTPNCDSRRGTFLPTQCDSQAYCWCVDPQMGRPILGTRKLQPVGDFCSDRKACPIFCTQRRLLECPFGVELDLDGCPLTSDCRCRTPCEQVRCPDGQICILQPRECQERERSSEEAQCLAQPTCLPSPCGGSLQPALGPVSKLLLHCRPGEDAELCPDGFRCTWPIHGEAAREGGGGGICCPLAEEEKRPKGGEGEEERTTTEEGGIAGGTSKANPCTLPLDQGGREHCTRSMELRFYHDFSENSCEEFVFAGCAGNANNFRSKEECEKRCPDGGEGGMEIFSMGFTLVPAPPHMTAAEEGGGNGQQERMESSLRSTLTRDFGLEQGQIRDVHVDRREGHVQFSIVAPDARRKAKSISDALASGQFQLPHENVLYGAQRDTWFARQVPMPAGDAGRLRAGGKSALFWVILTASIFFALIAVLAICCGYAFLHSRSRAPSRGGSVCFSPSPHVGAIHHHWSPLPNRKSADTLTPEEVQRMRANAAGGGAAHLLTPMPSSISSSSGGATHLPVMAASSSGTTATIVAPRIIAEEEGRRAERRTAQQHGAAKTTTMMYY